MDRPIRLRKKSSQIHEGSTYDDATGRFTAVLNDGHVHAYHSVPAEIIDGLEKSDSPGTYFHDNIRGRKGQAPFQSSRVR